MQEEKRAMRGALGASGYLASIASFVPSSRLPGFFAARHARLCLSLSRASLYSTGSYRNN